MIATLRGTVAEKLSDGVVIDVGNIGYGVLLPMEDYASVALGDEIKVYVYEHIRDNAHDLYAFTQPDTKRLFEQLIEVSGVGPKMALNILGVGSAKAVRQAIASGDIQLITAAPGVGKRLAERIVVELKDKVGLVVTAGADSVLLGNAAADQDEAAQALIALGYTVADALSALSGVDKTLTTEERVKKALRTTR
jgi:Holliday junction DNA helicase RuvA